MLGRITVDTGIAQIGTKVEIAPEMWDGKTGRAIGRSKQALLVNRTIDRLMEQAAKHYDDLVDLRGFERNRPQTGNLAYALRGA